MPCPSCSHRHFAQSGTLAEGRTGSPAGFSGLVGNRLSSCCFPNFYLFRFEFYFQSGYLSGNQPIQFFEISSSIAVLYIRVSHLGTEHVDVLAMAEHVVARPAELTLIVETVGVVDLLDIEEYQ